MNRFQKYVERATKKEMPSFISYYHMRKWIRSFMKRDDKKHLRQLEEVKKFIGLPF